MIVKYCYLSKHNLLRRKSWTLVRMYGSWIIKLSNISKYTKGYIIWRNAPALQFRIHVARQIFCCRMPWLNNCLTRMQLLEPMSHSPLCRCIVSLSRWATVSTAKTRCRDFRLSPLAYLAPIPYSSSLSFWELNFASEHDVLTLLAHTSQWSSLLREVVWIWKLCTIASYHWEKPFWLAVAVLNFNFCL